MLARLHQQWSIAFDCDILTKKNKPQQGRGKQTGGATLWDVGFIECLGLTLSRQQLYDYPVSCDCHAYVRAVTSRVGE
jgi:hypothetical protein